MILLPRLWSITGLLKCLQGGDALVAAMEPRHKPQPGSTAELISSGSSPHSEENILALPI